MLEGNTVTTILNKVLTASSYLKVIAAGKIKPIQTAAVAPVN
jgi:hypothetical protein